MGAILAQGAMDVAQGVIGTGIGLALQKGQDKRQLKQAKKLQEMEIAGSKQLTDYSYGKQLQMWKDTNYSAQMAELKKAGLNPGLLYGMGGAGGQSTGGGAEHVGSGGAPVEAGGAAQMGMGLQIAMIGAQKRLIEAQASKTKAEEEKIKGVDTQLAKSQIDKVIAETDNEKVKTELGEIQVEISQVQEEIAKATQNAQKALVMTSLREATERLEILTNEKIISNETKDTVITAVKQDLANSVIQGQLMKTQKNKTQKEIDQMAKELQLKVDALMNEKDKTGIQKKLAEFETSFGKQMSSILQSILGIGKGR